MRWRRGGATCAHCCRCAPAWCGGWLDASAAAGAPVERRWLGAGPLFLSLLWRALFAVLYDGAGALFFVCLRVKGLFRGAFALASSDRDERNKRSSRNRRQRGAKRWLSRCRPNPGQQRRSLLTLRFRSIDYHRELVDPRVIFRYDVTAELC